MKRAAAALLVRAAAVLNVTVAKLLAGIDDGPRWGGTASPLALLAERKPLRMMRAYTAIGDECMRRSLRQLAEGLARAAPRR